MSTAMDVDQEQLAVGDRAFVCDPDGDLRLIVSNHGISILLDGRSSTMKAYSSLKVAITIELRLGISRTAGLRAKL